MESKARVINELRTKNYDTEDLLIEVKSMITPATMILISQTIKAMGLAHIW